MFNYLFFVAQDIVLHFFLNKICLVLLSLLQRQAVIFRSCQFKPTIAVDWDLKHNADNLIVIMLLFTSPCHVLFHLVVLIIPLNQ